MRSRIITAVICLLSLSALALGGGASPLADRLPAKTLFYVGWAGENPAFDASLMGQLIDQSNLATVFDLIHRGVEIDEGEDEAAMAKHTTSLVGIIARRPLALGIIEVSPPEPPSEEEADEDTPPMPMGPKILAALLIELGDDQPAFAEALNALIELGEAPVEEAMVGETPCQRIMSPAGPVTFGYFGQTFFLTMGDQTPDLIAAITAETSLAGNSRFTDHLAAVSGEAVQMVTYLDIEAMRATVQPFLPPAPPEAEGDPASGPASGPANGPPMGGMGLFAALFNVEHFSYVWESAGIDRATVFVSATNVDGEMLHAKSRLFTPAPHQGMLTLYTGDPLTDEDLAGVPADADFVAAFNFPADKAFDEMMKRLAAFPVTGDPTPEEMVNQQLAALEDELGFAVRDDLIASLGQTWVMASAPSLGGFLAGTFMSVEVTDEQKLNHIIEQLEQLAKGERPTTQPADQPPAEMPMYEDDEYINEDMEDLETIVVVANDMSDIHYFAGGGSGFFPMPVAPAWTVHDGRFYVAAFPQVLETILAQKPAATLAETAAFKACQGKVGQAPCSMSFTNTPKIVGQVYNFVLPIWTMASNAARGEGMALDQHLLPSLGTVQKYLQPEMQTVETDEAGITWEWYGSVPLSGASGLGNIFTTTLFAMPSVAGARADAKRAVGANNTKMIGIAVTMYQAQNDSYPDGFEVLIDEGFLHEGALASPAGHAPPPEFAEGQLIGEVGYIYIKPGDDTQDHLILAYEKPEYYDHEGTNVVLVSGAAMWLPMFEFEELLEQSMQASGAPDDVPGGF